MWAWRAYMELATCRPVGFGGAGPIPWLAIHEYARAHSIDDESHFVRLMRTMDKTFLASRDD